MVFLVPVAARNTVLRRVGIQITVSLTIITEKSGTSRFPFCRRISPSKCHNTTAPIRDTGNTFM